MMDDKSLRETELIVEVPFAIDDTGSEAYATMHSIVGGLLLAQIWLLVIAVALILPVMGVVGLLLLAEHLFF